MPAGVFEILIGADGYYLGANEEALTALDYAPEELCALRVGALSGLDLDSSFAFWKMFMNGEVVFPTDRAGEFITRSGARVPIVHLGVYPTDQRGVYLSRSIPVREIDGVPDSLPTILGRWREAERRLAKLSADDPARDEVEGEVERLRLLYQMETNARLGAAGA